MKLIGTISNTQVFWTDYASISNLNIQNKIWVCLLIGNTEPDWSKFEDFIRKALEFGIVDFKSNGKLAEQLHDFFDFHLVDLNLDKEEKDWIEVMTTWHTNDSVADALWQAIHIAYIPDGLNDQHVHVLCMDMDGVNRKEELTAYIERFEHGWIPGF